MNEEEFTSWRCCLLALLRIDATKPKEDCEEKIKSLQLANKYISINASHFERDRDIDPSSGAFFLLRVETILWW